MLKRRELFHFLGAATLMASGVGQAKTVAVKSFRHYPFDPVAAENFLQKLKTDGFDASFAGKKDGLQLVAYGVYSSKAEAKKALQNIKQSGGNAWIRRN